MVPRGKCLWRGASEVFMWQRATSKTVSPRGCLVLSWGCLVLSCLVLSCLVLPVGVVHAQDDLVDVIRQPPGHN